MGITVVGLGSSHKTERRPQPQQQATPTTTNAVAPHRINTQKIEARHPHVKSPVPNKEPREKKASRGKEESMGRAQCQQPKGAEIKAHPRRAQKSRA